ncbi:MAG TPA: hypothetical protein VI306_09655 [Pyrinomonadaceae bacterium]
MKLDDLCEVFEALQFPGLGAHAHPERTSVLDARSAVGSAVVDEEFLVECISWELRRLEDDHLKHGLVPFFIVPGLGVKFAFGYWPPGGTPGPHEHLAWTITAVCRNYLEVRTYDREQTYLRRELVPKNCFPASAGRVGFIYEPCIHEPRNTSRDWSLSLHVISPRDGEPLLVDYEEPLPFLTPRRGVPSAVQKDPYTRVIVARFRRRFVHQLARILASMGTPQATQVLDQCNGLASSETRRFINTTQKRGRSDAPESQWFLARTHKDLPLSHRDKGDEVALVVETARGRIEELLFSKETRDAIAFVSREQTFDVRTLPGNLSIENKTRIADVLEETGLFTSMLQTGRN